MSRCTHLCFGLRFRSDHRQLSLRVDGTGASYTYDAFGRRVRAIANSQTVDFIFDPAGRALDSMSGTTWQRGEIFAGGMHLGTYNNLVNPATTNFEHTDWVGTARGRSNVAGTSLIETCTSLPFGDSQNCTTDVSPLHFAELTWDSESNLQHALFRQYSTTEGRWTVQDPSGLAAVDPSNPQSWNRYAYVANNPTTFNDPLGLFHCAAISGGVPMPGEPCTTDGDIWFGGGGGDSGGGGGFNFTFQGGMGACDSDFMPCGLPMPTLGQSIWSDVLGLPTGLNCPQTGGIFGSLCGGVSPIMDWSDHVICDTVLPNGQTVGDWIQQLSNGINQAAQNTPSGSIPPSPGSVADQVFASTLFRNIFRAPGANYKQLGDMGNFVYAAVSENLGVPFWFTEYVAGKYAKKAHPPAERVGPFGMDPSATVNVPLGYNSQCTD